jgi:AAA+ superfamily predicted ATPase
MPPILPPMPPIQPPLLATPSQLFGQNNSNTENRPKIKLLLFSNKNVNSNKKNKKESNSTTATTATNSSKVTTFENLVNSHNSSNQRNDDEMPGLLFFEQILNRLNNINNTNNNMDASTDNSNSDTEHEDDSELPYEWLGNNIKTIDDLIELGKSYDVKKRKRHNLNLKQLNKLVEPLVELKNMIGMSEVKKIIFDQIIYYLQNLDDKNVDMLHTVIVGPPGVGKTQLTYIIAKIYNRLGFLKTDKVICAKRDDLIGEYIGQTAPKTRKLLDKALGGVLLLDEIYSLAPTSDRDFAREAIDMINMYLSEHAHDLVCVIAGYKKPTYEKFFSQNEGLARRFTHHFEIKGYDANELCLIFKKYLIEQKWELSASIDETTNIVKDNIELFPNFGGDMTTLFACCKKAHSRRLLQIPTELELQNTKKKIQKDDILEAIKIYKDIKEKHSSTLEEDKSKYMHMYV